MEGGWGDGERGVGKMGVGEGGDFLRSFSSVIFSLKISVLALFGHHHLHKLFVVNLPVSIDIRLTDHLIDLLIREFLAQVRHNVAKLCCADEPVTVLVEYLERLEYFLLLKTS